MAQLDATLLALSADPLSTADQLSDALEQRLAATTPADPQVLMAVSQRLASIDVRRDHGDLLFAYLSLTSLARDISMATLRDCIRLALELVDELRAPGSPVDGAVLADALCRLAGFELELASGEAVPADPDAVAHLAPPARRPSLPVARS